MVEKPMSKPDAAPTPNDRAMTLDRGLQVLKLLAASEQDLSVAEIARAAGLHRQAVYRLLGTLVDHALAVQSSPGRYRLGFGTLNLTGSLVPRLQDVIRPHMRALAEACHATAFFFVREGDEAVVVLLTPPQTTDVHLTFSQGARYPLNRGAGGVAILATREPGPLETDDVREARRTGVAVTAGQLHRGAVGVAAPLLSQSWMRVDSSIGVATVSDGADLEQMKQAVLAAADTINREFSIYSPSGQNPYALIPEPSSGKAA
jgi:DNA-binding IclR family transcriptional regulator